MKFFIDTADIAESREAAAMDIIDGVTTNPSLVVKVARSLLEDVLKAGKMSVHVCTRPLKVLLQPSKHFLSERSPAQFLSDWEKVPS